MKSRLYRAFVKQLAAASWRLGFSSALTDAQMHNPRLCVDVAREINRQAASTEQGATFVKQMGEPMVDDVWRNLYNNCVRRRLRTS